MDNLVTLAQSLNQPPEFEIKIQNPDYKKVMSLSSQYSNFTTQTIDFIKSDGLKKKIKTLHFINNIQQPQNKKYTLKTKIKKYDTRINSLDCRINISSETPIPEFTDSFDIARIKYRLTIIYQIWNIDLTIIKSIPNPNNFEILKKEKDQLFSFPFETLIPSSQYELELECNNISELSTIHIKDIIQLIEPDTDIYNSTLTQICNLLSIQKKSTIKQIGPKIIPITKNIFKTIDFSDYFITDKVDGVRTFALIKNSVCSLINFEVKTFPVNSKGTFLLEGELYQDLFYIYDVLVYDSEIIKDNNFSSRLTYFDKIPEISPIFKTKEFYKMSSTKFRDEIFTFSKHSKPFLTDGYVLTEDSKYFTSNLYKYKYINTIDFLVRKCPESQLNKKPFILKKKYLYLLFNGINTTILRNSCIEKIPFYYQLFKPSRNEYIPIQFSPSINQYAYLFHSDIPDLDNQICELANQREINFMKKSGHELNEINEIKEGSAESESSESESSESENDESENDESFTEEWVLYKIRHDRKIDVENSNYFGNDFEIAEKTFTSYISPLIIESYYPSNYFKVDENNLYKDSRAFNNYVKSEIIKQYTQDSQTVDLASGKGQDILKYCYSNSKNILFVENDDEAILELINRKFDTIKNFKLDVKLLKADITNSSIYENIKPYLTNKKNVKYINCNLAVHYFTSNEKDTSNFCKFINSLISSTGIFTCTSLDSTEIDKLPDKWDITTTNDILKYSIIKKKLNQIDILLPFSDNTYYTETPVNIKKLSAEFSKYNIKLISDLSFSTYFDNYKKSLNEDDKKFCSLYHIYVFKKESKK